VCEALRLIEGPLSPFLESQTQWGAKMFGSHADFAVQVVLYTNVLFVAPVAVLLALGFVAGSKFVKNLALIHAAVMLYSQIIVDVYAYEALAKFEILDLENVALGAGVVYGFSTVFPLVVVRRVWSDSPFAGAPTKRSFLGRWWARLLQLTLFVWFLAAVTSLYEFSVRHTPSMASLPSVVDSSVAGWEQIGPYREQLEEYTADFRQRAGEHATEALGATRDVLTELGQPVVDWARDLLGMPEVFFRVLTP